jgi:hypothetical protein
MTVHVPGFATLQDRLIWLLILFTTAKLLSTLSLVMLGDYRAPRTSLLQRTAGITSKTTPSLMCLAAGALAFTRGYLIWGTVFIAGSLLIAGFAAYITYLRRCGRFYGAADWMLRYLGPRQVKIALLAALPTTLILVHISGCGKLPI